MSPEIRREISQAEKVEQERIKRLWGYGPDGSEFYHVTWGDSTDPLACDHCLKTFQDASDIYHLRDDPPVDEPNFEPLPKHSGIHKVCWRCLNEKIANPQDNLSDLIIESEVEHLVEQAGLVAELKKLGHSTPNRVSFKRLRAAIEHQKKLKEMDGEHSWKIQ